jgi:pectinesterase
MGGRVMGRRMVGRSGDGERSGGEVMRGGDGQKRRRRAGQRNLSFSPTFRLGISDTIEGKLFQWFRLCRPHHPIAHSPLLLFIFLILSSTASAQTNLTVAQDGSRQFKSVQDAIMSVPAGSEKNPVVIHVKPGTYKELIYIQHEKRFFKLVGEDANTTILTFDLNANLVGPNNKPIGTFRTPSTVIDADDFTAENITFENTAGPVGQALALRVDGDRAVFRRCRFLGWQDTIFLNRGRQYFEDCYITGHVDFIFGAATAFFERCHIHCLRSGYITAASTYDYVRYGFVFSNCKITGENAEVKTYLGRPWRDFSAVTYLNTEMSDVVRPVGWQNWDLPAREKTSRYAEYNSKGAGANPKARVAWSKQLSRKEARAITIKNVLSGDDGWDPLRQGKM